MPAESMPVTPSRRGRIFLMSAIPAIIGKFGVRE
jgi:hypothetical protein